jgi:hypothetical protein
MKIGPGPGREIGEVRLGPDGKLLMPVPGPGPGIYRFRLTGGGARAREAGAETVENAN